MTARHQIKNSTHDFREGTCNRSEGVEMELESRIDR